MRRLHAASLAAFLLACSGDGTKPGAIVLGIHTNDLAITGDVNLLGVYVAHQDAEGRVVERLAYEATPLLDEAKNVHLTFPSTLVLQSSGSAGDRVHVKLVAYKGATREVLTMREARAAVPTDDSQILQLNLFFTNQNNVVDAQPGASVLGAGLTLQDQDGAITEQGFGRFTSVCDGHPAGENETADEHGGCVPLDLPTEAYDEERGIRGANPDDTCYDVAQTFDPRDDGAVRQIPTAALPTAGACTVQLPGRYVAANLNVALLTTESAFPAGAAYGDRRMRPLAANVAFVAKDDHTLELPERVCALARRPEVQALVVSQRTAQWAGADPVCAPWSVAKSVGRFDGPTPEPAPDGGVAPESGIAEHEIGAASPAKPGTASLVADGSEGAYSFVQADTNFMVRAYRYDTPGDSQAKSFPQGDGSRLYGVRFASTLEYYVRIAIGESIEHVKVENGDVIGFDQITTPGEVTGPPFVGMAPSDDGVYGLKSSGLYAMADAITSKSDLAIPMTLASPKWPAYTTDHSGHATGLVLDGTDAYFINFEAATAVPQTGSAPLPGEDLVGAGGAFYGIAQGGQIVRYTPGTAAAIALEGTYERLAGIGDHLCFSRLDGGVRHVGCLNPASLGDEAAKPLQGDLADAAVAVDESYVHVLYACTAEPTKYLVVKVPWDELGASTPLTTRCLAQQ